MSRATESLEPPPTPRPSVFISYSSEDRAAVRALREALTEAGLEVWHDENELGGGDAWDQKIRRQIRECHYFLPVISASTERRSEGYFRREWRLAVERNLDMADDVLFIVPVVIDDTREGNARVPERFLAVQWQRIPGGQPGPALQVLARRLLIGQSKPASRPPLPPVSGRAAQSDPVPARSEQAPPPMPPFPSQPTDGHKLRYFAEIVWWAIHAVGILIRRLPRWGKVLLILWLLFGVIFRCSNSDENPAKKARDEAQMQHTEKAVRESLKELGVKNSTDVTLADLAKVGEKFVDKMQEEDDEENGRTAMIGVGSFAKSDVPAESQWLASVHDTLFGQLAIAEAGLVRPFEDTPGVTDASLAATAAKAGLGPIVVARLERPPEGAVLVVQLLARKKGTSLWTGRFPLAGADAAAVARGISQAVVAHTAKPAISPP
jgi:TIR domain